jgi:hypothetical protein
MALFACVWASCSLMVDADPVQCRQDRDCQRFANTVCDRTDNVCVNRLLTTITPDAAAPPDATAPDSAADAALDASAAEAAVDVQIADAEDAPTCVEESDAGQPSACPAATCVPFDNQARLTILGPDGGLRPLP